MLKTERKQYIIDLSKKFSIVTPYTSFVAVEDRTQVCVNTIQKIIPLLNMPNFQQPGLALSHTKNFRLFLIERVYRRQFQI